MWRSRKFIWGVAIAIVLMLVGSVGVVFAQTENGDDSQPKMLAARIAEILGIDQQRVEDALTQARTEMREEALDSRLQNLVKEGRMTQEQADQYKTWLQSSPDMSQYRQQLKDWQQTRPGMPPEMNEWQQSKPDLPEEFGRAFHKGFGRGFRGR